MDPAVVKFSADFKSSGAEYKCRGKTSLDIVWIRGENSLSRSFPHSSYQIPIPPVHQRSQARHLRDGVLRRDVGSQVILENLSRGSVRSDRMKCCTDLIWAGLAKGEWLPLQYWSTHTFITEVGVRWAGELWERWGDEVMEYRDRPPRVIGVCDVRCHGSLVSPAARLNCILPPTISWLPCQEISRRLVEHLQSRHVSFEFSQLSRPHCPDRFEAPRALSMSDLFTPSYLHEQHTLLLRYLEDEAVVLGLNFYR